MLVSNINQTGCLHMTEYRHSHRVNFDCLVEFKTDEVRHVCELVDVSIKGALIAACSGATPKAGTPCQLTISLNDAEENKIIMMGTVARKIENRVGIHCDTIDVDSMSHLRRLIEYNLGDVELVNRDFDALVHEH